MPRLLNTSAISARPGPDVAVMALAPPIAAPIIMLDEANLALGLNKDLALLRQTAGDIFQHLRLRSDGITGEEVKPASYRGLAYCLIALYCYFLAHCAPHLKTLMALSGHIIPHSLQPMHLSGSA